MTQTETQGDESTPKGMNPRLRTAIATVIALGAVIGLAFTAKAAVTGDAETSLALPDAVDRLIPASGDEVLRPVTLWASTSPRATTPT